MLAVLRSALDGDGHLVELGGAGHELDLLTVAGGHRRQVAVGDDLRVLVELVEGLVGGPHPLEPVERRRELSQRQRAERLVEAGDARLGVLGAGG